MILFQCQAKIKLEPSDFHRTRRLERLKKKRLGMKQMFLRTATSQDAQFPAACEAHSAAPGSPTPQQPCPKECDTATASVKSWDLQKMPQDPKPETEEQGARHTDLLLGQEGQGLNSARQKASTPFLVLLPHANTTRGASSGEQMS